MRTPRRETGGHGAWRFGRCRLSLTPVLALVAALAFGVAPAAAAAPETPELKVASPVHATEAVFLGVLSPKATEPVEGGSYKFLFKAGAACEGGSETAPGLSFGSPHEELPGEPVSALSAGTEYTVCLKIETAGGTAVSAPVTFTTAVPPEPPVTSSPAQAVTATTAVLEGTVNPKAEAETGWHFLYGTEPTCASGVEAPGEPPAKVKAKKVHTEVKGLQPLRKYVFCLLATNTAGEPVQSTNEVSFSTPAAPPVITGVTSFAVKAHEARVEALVNPNNEPSECDVQYGTTVVSEHEVSCAPEVLKGFGEQPAAATLTGLEQGKLYHFRFVAANEQSRKEGKPTAAEGQFTTRIPPETPTTLPAQSVTGTTAKLEGVLNPTTKGEAGSYQFLYRQSTTECAGAAETAGGLSTGETPEPVPAEEAKGLLPNTTYTYCLRAINAAGETATGAPVTFTTQAIAPEVSEPSVTEVGSTSALLHATVDPGGTPTSYFFEYGPTEAYGSSTPVQSAGAGSHPISVQAALEGLTPDAPYHFRAVITFATGGRAEGADTTFSTLPAAAPGLPDGRGYEIVSPLDGGHVTVVPDRPAVRAAADGSKVTYLRTIPPTGGNSGGEVPPTEGPGGGIAIAQGDNQYLAERLGTGGWTSTLIQPTGVKQIGYQSFSSDLSEAIIGSPEPLSEHAPGGGYAGLYARSALGGYVSLFARTPSHSAATPERFKPAFAGASARGSHELFEANDALLEAGGQAAEELNTFAGEKPVRALYDSTGGRLVAVDVLPEGHIAPEASYGSPVIVENAYEPRLSHRLDHVISVDGSRIFWTDTGTEKTLEDPSGATRLFVRENDASPSASTVQIDASQAPAGNGATEVKERAERSGAGVFMTASANGEKVYFTDTRQLTADSLAEPGEPDLYLYNFEPPAGQPHLTDLTTGVQTPGEHAHVVGVLGASEDGSYVYFAAAGALAPGATPRGCRPEGDPLCNVYVLHEGESPSFVAAVPRADGVGRGEGVTRALPDGGLDRNQLSGDWVEPVGARTAQVTPDGRHLVFESVANLTGFDAKGSAEVYLYDFGAKPSCVSCSPAGAPALSQQLLELPESLELTYALRDISSNGDRVFFNSREALVSNDNNNQTDVYEWERGGSGSCTRVKGCLYLLSGATSSVYSAFVDASESGDDVFFASRAQLVPQDHGELYELYDARVGAVEPTAPPACTGAGCQGVPGAPPIFATPSSVTFQGAGNFPPTPPGKPKTAAQLRAEHLATALKACRKIKSRRHRATCERQAHKKFQAKQAAKRAATRAGVHGRAK